MVVLTNKDKKGNMIVQNQSTTSDKKKRSPIKKRYIQNYF